MEDPTDPFPPRETFPPGEEGLGEEEALLSAKLRLLFRHLDEPEPEPEQPAVEPIDPDERSLGEFRLLREIGSGGMATVYEAEQVSLNRRVALKILAPHLALSRRSVQKFQREAEAGGRPVHPGIVAIHAVGEEAGVHYIAEELVEGGRTLADSIEEQRRRAAPPRGWFRLVAEQLAAVADALAHAHDCEVIHRDVKPSNILLMPDGRPKVGDFGLARIEDALTLSRSGDLTGTPYYMSPEQAFGKRSGVDHRTDVYSLGVTLYECLTLRRPFAGESTDEVLSAILLRDPPDPCRLDARVPKDLAAVCLKAMEKDPRRRYSGMRELAEDLRRFHAGEAVRAEPVGRLGHAVRWLSRRKLQAAGAAVALLAGIALIVMAALLAAQRGERLRVAEGRFQPLRETLWLGHPGVGRKVDKWHAQADPANPDGPMLAALSALARGTFEPAAEALERCLELCAQRGDAALARDARHLLACIDLEFAQAAAPEVAEALRIGATRELDAVGEFDPLDDSALVWRGTAAPIDLHGLRLNVEHRLVHSYLGISGFEELYKGGGPEAFRDTIAHLEAAVAQRADEAVTTGILARTYLFQARTYDLHHVLPRAEELSLRTIELAREHPFYLWSTTLGQIRLLHGDGPGALEAFTAADAAAPPSSCDGHNVRLGFGRAYALLGRTAEAEASLLQALEACRGDPHSLLALVELLRTADPDGSLERARAAWRRPDGAVRYARSGTDMAAAALAAARILLARDDVPAAQGWLRELVDQSIPSPRDYGQACRLALTVPPEQRSSAPELDLESTVAVLVEYLEWIAEPPGGEPSAITLSGLGAGQVLLGRPVEAVAALEQARTARERWPDDVRVAQWADEACDLYALALAHHELGRLDPDQREARARRAMGFHDEAELLVLAHDLPTEQADVLIRLRERARQVLGES